MVFTYLQARRQWSSGDITSALRSKKYAERWRLAALVIAIVGFIAAACFSSIGGRVHVYN